MECPILEQLELLKEEVKRLTKESQQLKDKVKELMSEKDE